MNVVVHSPGRTGIGTTVTDAETGQEVRGIAAIDLAIRVDDFNRATIELVNVQVERVHAKAEFIIADPSTGKMKPVQRVEFADGTSWSPEA